jgi:hypothetical protein
MYQDGSQTDKRVSDREVAYKESKQQTLNDSAALIIYIYIYINIHMHVHIQDKSETDKRVSDLEVAHKESKQQTLNDMATLIERVNAIWNDASSQWHTLSKRQVCMYVCIYECIRMYVCIYTCIRMYVCVYAWGNPYRASKCNTACNTA